jgi:hypothetical protein
MVNFDVPTQREIFAKVLTMTADRALLYTGDAVFKRMAGMARARHWRSLVNLASELEMQMHTRVVDHYVYSQVVALLKKYPYDKSELPGFDPEAAAWKKFQAAEHRCRRVNQRSALLRYGVGFPHGDVLSIMRGYIRSVIGDKPNMDRIYDRCDWGPGANVGVSGDLTNFGRKLLADTWSVTPLALSYCTEMLWRHEQIRVLLLSNFEAAGPVSLDPVEFRNRLAAKVRLVDHNNISFVPKTYLTHRSIASEPLLNGMLQKGIDEELRSLLCDLAGIDLRRQEPNQLMAREGSLGGSDPYATIDLSSASDSISWGIVKTLLPSAWFDLLDRSRSHRYKYRGVVRRYEKFVSMGNGFCFPLQTLLFSALCYAVAKTSGVTADFRVYGDDIIVRRSLALLVAEVLRYLGFKVNRDKTCITGEFRESCGTDWYSGQDVRPAYLDFRFDSNVALYKFHNSTLRSDIALEFFEPVRDYLRQVCPPEVRFVRPYHGNADGCFTVPKDVAMSCPFVRWERQTWGWSWLEVKTQAVADPLSTYPASIATEVKYLAALRTVGTGQGETKIRQKRTLESPPPCRPSREPLAVRRKTRARVARIGYPGRPGCNAWVDAAPGRPETDL